MTPGPTSRPGASASIRCHRTRSTNSIERARVVKRTLVVRLVLMLGLAAMLAVRTGCIRGLRAHSFARGSAGTSSGEDGGAELRAAGAAPAALEAPLTPLGGKLTDAAGRARTPAEIRAPPLAASA